VRGKVGRVKVKSGKNKRGRVEIVSDEREVTNFKRFL
jgi:hypothetical protein